MPAGIAGIQNSKGCDAEIAVHGAWVPAFPAGTTGFGLVPKLLLGNAAREAPASRHSLR